MKNGGPVMSKTFNGEVYDLYMSHVWASEAKKIAKELRASGRKVRVVSGFDPERRRIYVRRKN